MRQLHDIAKPFAHNSLHHGVQSSLYTAYYMIIPPSIVCFIQTLQALHTILQNSLHHSNCTLHYTLHSILYCMHTILHTRTLLHTIMTPHYTPHYTAHHGQLFPLPSFTAPPKLRMDNIRTTSRRAIFTQTDLY